MTLKRLLLFLVLLSLFPLLPVQAQGGTAVYIVQPGDTLSSIAERFRLSPQSIISANGLANPNFLQVGQRLILPGLDLAGTLTTLPLQPGMTFETLARQYHMDSAPLRRVNRLISPDQIYIGQTLIVLQEAIEKTPPAALILRPGESWLEAAVRQGINPWSLLDLNNAAHPETMLPGETCFVPSSETREAPLQILPPSFLSASLEPLPPLQGDTVEIKIKLAPGFTPAGRLGDYELHFFPLPDQTWVALQGIHAMLEPGLYPLHIEARAAEGSQTFEQKILIGDGGYPQDPVLYVKDETTIDPKVMDAEWQQVLQITAPVTPERLWEGTFQSPAALFPEPECFTSRFGNRREYRAQNNPETVFYSFHSGVDFCGGAGLSIAAPAAGVVVYTGTLNVRGNVTFIHHGWGIYTGYFHQAQIYVHPGDKVTPGQIIGVVGDTGRVTGAHLHWELWVNGVQVNPIPWLQRTFP